MNEESSLFLPAVAAGLLVLGVVAWAISDGEDANGRRWWHTADVAPVTNETYRSECGACHMAYQPGLLPRRAWQIVMRPEALADHYGDIASLGDPLRSELEAYLFENAADRAKRPRSRAFSVASRSDPTPSTELLPRVSETRYFRLEHHEIPQRLVGAKAAVRSFGQCDACHRGADVGVYKGHEVVIPGLGPWED